MKKITLCMLILAIMLCLAVPALAQEQEAELTYLDTTKDVVFWVRWDVEMPQIIFIAPDGTEYDPLIESDTTTTLCYEEEMYYVVLGAQEGQWRVRYDKLGNTNVEIMVMDYSAGFGIEYFTMEPITSGNSVPVEFLVYGDSGISYNYRISAVVDYSGAEIELLSGRADTGRKVEKNVNLKTLASYSGYMLRLYVWYEEDGADIFDFAYSEPFDYTNSNIDSWAVDFGVTILPDEQIVLVTWGNLSYRIDDVLIAIYENDQEQPTSFSDYPASQRSVQLSYAPSDTSITIAFAVNVDGTYTQPVKKTIVLADFALSAQEGNACNSLVWPVEYRDMDSQNVELVINGETSFTELHGSGTIHVMLVDDWNKVTMRYTTGENITWQIEREIYVDRKPPVLTMNQNYDGMRVAGNTLTVDGTVIHCDTLTVNGQEIVFQDDGTFSCTLTLNAGENTVQIVARDALGNVSAYHASVFSGPMAMDEEIPTQSASASLLEHLTNGYWVLAIASVMGILVIVYAAIYWKRGERKS